MADTINVATIVEPFLVKERNIVLIPDDPKYHPLLPAKTKTVVLGSRMFYALPNSPRTNKMLRDAGYVILSPMYFDKDYDWARIKPFAAQVESAALMIAHHKIFNLSDLGTGKTYSTLFAIDWLIKNGHARNALITAPLSILHNVWEASIYNKFPRLKPVVLHGTAEKRRKLLNTSGFNVYIINHDGVKVLEDDLVKRVFDIVIIDELGSFRDAQSSRWKATRTLVRNATYVSGLTGSPTPTGPWDAYAQRKLIKPEGFKYTYTQFKNVVGLQVSPYRWVPRRDSAQKVYEVLQPAVRFKRSQVVELKANYVIDLTVQLSREQEDCRKALIDNAVALYKQGSVRADTAASLCNKILQASLGAVYTSDEERSIIDLKNVHRIEMAFDLVDQAAGKAIIAVPYVSLLPILEAEAKSRKRLLEIVQGSVPPKERHEIFKRFQDPYDPLRLIIAQPSCMAHGVTLTEADTIIWYGPVTKYEVFQQFNGRIIRPGQNREQLIYLLQGSEIEKKFYAALKSNGNMQDTILQMFETQTF